MARRIDKFASRLILYDPLDRPITPQSYNPNKKKKKKNQDSSDEELNLATNHKEFLKLIKALSP